jgi:hypothetical protein
MPDSIQPPDEYFEWPKQKLFHGSRGGGKTFDAAQQKRVADLLESNRRLFLLESRANPIVNRAVQVALNEDLREEDAWLLAIIGLIEENRTLMENAQALIQRTAPERIVK